MLRDGFEGAGDFAVVEDDGAPVVTAFANGLNDWQPTEEWDSEMSRDALPAPIAESGRRKAG